MNFHAQIAARRPGVLGEVPGPIDVSTPIDPALRAKLQMLWEVADGQHIKIEAEKDLDSSGNLLPRRATIVVVSHDSSMTDTEAYDAVFKDAVGVELNATSGFGILTVELPKPPSTGPIKPPHFFWGAWWALPVAALGISLAAYTFTRKKR